MIGTVVDQYKILEQLGGGGMGQVYRALDLELDREVAIKCVRPELANLEEVTQRFRTEARTLAKLSHQNIATVYRFFDHEGQLFLVMELIQGRPFGKMLLEDGAQSPQSVVSMMRQALTGLGYAHQHQVVHRDIKPGNLMLAGGDVVKVLDFGIAHLLDGGTRLTQVGSVVGTPAYMAPEQVLGRAVDPRTDLYSLGIVLYEMLTGKLPFEANSDFEIMRAQIEQVPRPLGKLSMGVPGALQNTIDTALSKDMSDRFQTAEQFADSLHDSLGVSGVKFPPVATDPDATKVLTPLNRVPESIKLGRHPVKLYAMAAAGVSVVALASLFLLTGESDDQPSVADAPEELNVGSATALVSESDAVVDQTSALVEPATPSLGENQSAALQSLAADSLATTPIAAEPTAAQPIAPKPIVAEAIPAEAIAPKTIAPKTNAPITSAPAPSPTKSTNAKPNAAKPVVAKPIAAKPIKPQSVGSAGYSIRSLKVSVHKRQKTGRFSRAAGYSGSFVLDGPPGDDRELTVDEFIEVHQDGRRVLREKISTQTHKRGRFGTKTRVQELKLLPYGTYDVSLVFESAGVRLGAHDWKLEVVD